VTCFAGLRNGVEFPHLRAGPGIVGARVAGRALGHFQYTGAYHHDVPENGRHTRISDGHIHYAFLAEARIDLTGVCVERDQVSSEVKMMRGGFCLSPGQ
jgi:hypothetical protein